MVDRFSFVPLFIEPFFKSTQLASATGFAMLHNEKSYLITNWHVVTGRHAETNEPLDKKTSAIPDTLQVQFHDVANETAWQGVKIPLFNNGAKTWLEHPEGRKVDLIAIPLPDAGEYNIKVITLNMELTKTDLYIAPGEPISIVGFPLGKPSFGYFPIWKTGHVASDIDLDYDKKPVFLVDATTKEGMSGSPVVAVRNGMFSNAENTFLTAGNAFKFLGVYSGRIPGDSDIGLVWKPNVLEEIFTHIQ